MAALFAEAYKTDFPYWWEEAPPLASADLLPSSIDVAIVGGGYTGLAAALTLARLGRTVAVLEANLIGSGASTRNGGLISGGLKVPEKDLHRKYGKEAADAIVRSTVDSFFGLEDFIRDEGIECDYVRCGRFTPAWVPGHFRALGAKASHLARLTGLPTRMVPRERQREAIGSDHYYGGMIVDASGSLHPAKYLKGLADLARASGARLIDNAGVTGIDRSKGGFSLHTRKGEVFARDVLVATNGYSMNGRGESAFPWLARRLIPVGSYMIATEPLDPALIRSLFPDRRTISDTKRVLNYFRASPDGTRVLWGGRASFSNISAHEAAPTLHRYMTNAFPELKDVRITHAWTGNVAFSFDFMPHIGEHDGVHFAAGCQGSGVAMATWLGRHVARKIGGDLDRPFALDLAEFPTKPFYDGRPWFLPAVGNWYRLADTIERRLA